LIAVNFVKYSFARRAGIGARLLTAAHFVDMSKKIGRVFVDTIRAGTLKLVLAIATR
jgi:hypothetical protein